MSKKRIIAIVAIVVLLLAAGISVGVFLSTRGESAAVDGNEVVDGTQAGNNVQDSENNDQPGNTIPDAPTENPEDGNADEVIPGDENTDGVNDNEHVDNENNPAENAGNANAGNAGNGNAAGGNNQGNNAGITTDTNVNDVGETTITRVEEQERLVSEDFLDWWKPMQVNIANPTVLGLDIPQLAVKKHAITGVGGDQFIYAGQELTYVIAVTNNGIDSLENIEITDKIPQNTTFVSIKDAVIINEVDDKLVSEVVGTKTTIQNENVVAGVKWIVTIPAGETVIARFTVNVNETTGTIYNTAIANGQESNDGEPTKTSIIKANKTSIITRNNEEVKIAKIGDLITYTIEVTNTGESEGTTYIIDKVPKGTVFVSAENNAIVSEEQNQVAWSIVLGAKETVTRTFTVKVENVNGNIANIADVGGTDTKTDITETAGITVSKEVVDIKRDGESVEITAPVKENDVIEYKITVTNNGSKDLANVLVDEKLVGIDLNEEELQVGKLKAGESVEIVAKYTVTYESDIKGKGNREILNEVYVSGETIPENPDEEPEKVENEDEEKTIVEEAPSVEVVKVADKKEALKAGETVSYTITVKNTGNVTLKDVEVADTLTTSEGTTSLPLYLDAEYKTEPVTKLETIAVGETVTLYAKYTVTQDDIDAQAPISNIATAMNTPSDPEIIVPEDDAPGVEVVKVADKKENVKAGETVNYTITVKNTGNVTLTKVAVSDTITTAKGTENLTLYSDKDCTKAVTEIETIAVDQTVTLYAKYVVTQDDIDAQVQISNIATAGTTPSEPEVIVPEDDAPGVEVVKVADKKENVKAGEIINYTITVKNTGNVTLTKVAVSDTITTAKGPENLILYSDKEYTKAITEIGTISVGQTVTLYARYTVTQDDIDAQVQISNIATAGTTPSEPEIIVPEDDAPGVEVVKVADKKENVKAGETVNYTITVKNTGNVTLKDVEVADTLTTSEGTTSLPLYLDEKCETEPVTKITTIGVGQTVTLYTKYVVTQTDIDAQKPISNIATAMNTPSEPEIIVPEDDAPGVEVVKVADKKENVKAGETVNYTITVKNTGNVTLKDVEVADTLTTSEGTENLTLYSDKDCTKAVTEIETISVVQTVTLYARYTVTQDDIDAQKPISNIATAMNTPSEPEIIVPEDDAPGVEVVKVADKKENVKAGETVNYTITVKNTGNVTLKDVEVADTLTTSEGTTSLPLYLDEKCETEPVTKITTIGVGQTVALYTKYVVTQTDIDAQKPISNIATAGTTPSEPEIIVPEDDAPGVEVVKVADKKENVKAGETVNYTITVKNTGNVTLTKVAVSDTLTTAKGTENLTLYSDKDCTKAVTEVETINVGQTVTLYAKYKVTQDDIDAQVQISNIATAGTTPSEPEVIVPEDDAPGVEVVKVADKKENVKAGETVNYTITVKNTGNVTLTKVAVLDTITTAKGKENLTLYSDKDCTKVVTEIETINVGQTVTLYAKYTVTQDDINAQVQISNIATAMDTPSKPEVVIPEDDNPELKVEKKAIAVKKSGTDTFVAINGKVRPGDVIKYIVTVSNTGNTTLTNIVVTDKTVMIDTNGNVKNETSPESTIGTIATLLPGQTAEPIEVLYTITDEDVTCEGKIKNVATAKAKDNTTGTGSDETVEVNPSIEVKITKIWKDSNNADGSRPQLITVNLYGTNKAEAERVATFSETEYTFRNLPKYDENGNEIAYTVVENPVVGYQSSLAGNAANGYTFTNTRVIDIPVEKKWVDGNGKDGLRPSTIDVSLKNGNIQIATATIKAADSWKYTFKDMTKYDEKGAEIGYKVVETSVPNGYTSSIDGFVITNTQVTDIEVTKNWVDSNNADNVRPSTIDVALKVGDTQVATGTIEAANSWKYTFENLQKYNTDGSAIAYTVVETSVPDGYTSAVEGFTITNTRTTDVQVTKVWEDYDNHFGARTPITITVSTGGNEVGRTTISGTQHTFNLPKYDVAGNAIEYTVGEEPVAGYITNITGNTADGFTITNTYKNVTVSKNVQVDSTQSTTKTKVDVVFVLDISGSMIDEDNKVDDGNGNKITRAEAMVNATNKAITTILSKNTATEVNSRVGVVMYSTGVTTVLPLSSYTALNNTASDNNVGEFLKYAPIINTYPFIGSVVEGYGITTNVQLPQGQSQVTKEVTGGTYTQLGIKEGATMLANSTDASGRVPVMILLTDGEATYGTTDYSDVTTTSNVGSGNSTESAGELGEIGYLTVLSANYYKNSVINPHYATAQNPNIAQVYTIGFGLTGEFNQAVLDPNNTKVTACNNSSATGAQDLYNYLTKAESIVKYNTEYDWYGNLDSYDEMELENPYENYSYANGSYTGNMDATKLETILKDIVSNIPVYEPQEITTTTNIKLTTAEVELPGIDTTKNIVIEVDGTLKTAEGGSTVASLIEDGVIIERDGKYYIDLTASIFEGGKTIEILYH